MILTGKALHLHAPRNVCHARPARNVACFSASDTPSSAVAFTHDQSSLHNTRRHTLMAAAVTAGTVLCDAPAKAAEAAGLTTPSAPMSTSSSRRSSSSKYLLSLVEDLRSVHDQRQDRSRPYTCLIRIELRFPLTLSTIFVEDTNLLKHHLHAAFDMFNVNQRLQIKYTGYAGPQPQIKQHSIVKLKFHLPGRR